MLLSLAFSLQKCTYHPFLPPGEIIEASSPNTNSKGQYIVSGGVGMATVPLGFTLADMMLKLKYGLTDKHQLETSISLLSVAQDEEHRVNYSNKAINSYLGMRYLVVPKILSIFSGIGIGGSSLGKYSSINYGGSIGYENKFVVPFWQFYLYNAFPINPKKYDLSPKLAIANTFVYTPLQTNGYKFDFGIKLPLSDWFHAEEKHSLGFSFGIASLHDSQRDAVAITLAAIFNYEIK